MAEWEEWSPFGGGDNDDFPKLKTLVISDCPKLRGNLPKLLPSLLELDISRCGELTAIIQGDVSPRSLTLQGCKNVVFENKTNSVKSLHIDIGGLESNSLSVGMMKKCINLEELRIREWPSLTHLPDEGLPTTLRKLTIILCKNLDFDTLRNYKQLSFLSLYASCGSMTSFPLSLLPNLQNLKIYSENLESFSIEDEDRENLKSLQSLTIEGCDKFINFPTGGLWTPNLVSLIICECKKLKSLPEGMNTQLISLQKFEIEDCEQVESFPAGGLPSSLQSLHIMNCEKLMAKRREWDLHTLSSLNTLEIEGGEEIESFPEAQCLLPTSITHLRISELPNLKTIDASRLPNIQSLKIRKCPKVEFNSKSGSMQEDLIGYVPFI